MKSIYYLSFVLFIGSFISCDEYEEYNLDVLTPEVNIKVVGMDGFIVSFKNNTINAQNYYWEFGDGNTSSESEPEYEYELPGDWRIYLSAYSEGYFKADTDSLDISIPGETGVASNFIGKYTGISQIPGGVKAEFTTTTTLVEGENAILFGNLLKTNKDMYIGWGYQLLEGHTNDYAKIVLEENGIISIPNQLMYTLTGWGWTGSVQIQGRGRYNAETGTLSLEYAELWDEQWDGETIHERVIIARK